MPPDPPLLIPLTESYSVFMNSEQFSYSEQYTVATPESYLYLVLNVKNEHLTLTEPFFL